MKIKYQLHTKITKMCNNNKKCQKQNQKLSKNIFFLRIKKLNESENLKKSLKIFF